ncbi:hypothetical protein ALC60_13272 [Trachymyrmex zeteki]|uniref:Chromo domain-containing protein n=1 Tax=Mycetomoellerius zeteki TaxID=64791 RepID=A0A151WIY7_9HYME|nr:hypothetical protein ALC60_13272 [Trachymyrmex zeteki]
MKAIAKIIRDDGRCPKNLQTKDMYLVEKVLRKKGKEVYVKWLGFDNSHNS